MQEPGELPAHRQRPQLLPVLPVLRPPRLPHGVPSEHVVQRGGPGTNLAISPVIYK